MTRSDEEQTINDLASDPDDGFNDIDALLSDMVQQKDITTSGATRRTDVGVGSGSSAVCPMKGSTQGEHTSYSKCAASSWSQEIYLSRVLRLNLATVSVPSA